jgi:hypothetical protein
LTYNFVYRAQEPYAILQTEYGSGHKSKATQDNPDHTFMLDMHIDDLEVEVIDENTYHWWSWV